MIIHFMLQMPKIHVLLKIKVLYWHVWFHEEHLTSIEPVFILMND